MGKSISEMGMHNLRVSGAVSIGAVNCIGAAVDVARGTPCLAPYTFTPDLAFNSMAAIGLLIGWLEPTAIP